eukprot:11148251-Alexandrium_andersonii.AAC.1
MDDKWACGQVRRGRPPARGHTENITHSSRTSETWKADNGQQPKDNTTTRARSGTERSRPRSGAACPG